MKYFEFKIHGRSENKPHRVAAPTPGARLLVHERRERRGATVAGVEVVPLGMREL